MYGHPYGVATWAAHHQAARRRSRNRVILALVGLVALGGAVHSTAAILWRVFQ